MILISCPPFQIGHEPIPSTRGRYIWGTEAYFFPNIRQYGMLYFLCSYFGFSQSSKLALTHSPLRVKNIGQPKN